MSGGRLYTIRARLGDDVYVGRSLIALEPAKGDVVEYAGAVRVGGEDSTVYVNLELEVIRRRINVAAGAPIIEAVVTGGVMHTEAERALELLRFTKADG